MKIVISSVLQTLLVTTGAVVKCRALRVQHSMLGSWRSLRFRRQSPSMHVLQGMYESLAAIPNIQSSTKDPWSCKKISQCLSFMGKVSISDLSLEGYRIKETVYMEIASTPHFQIAAFVLPKGRTLPVHDHPDMTVISKVVSGELSVVSFSAKDSGSKITSIPVTLQDRCIKDAKDKPWMISPTVGNYHEFTAKSDCVILDVLLPPYAYPERPCTYYRATPSIASTQSSSSASLSDQWTLTTISEAEAHQQFGLPMGVEYPGYVPKPNSS